MAKTSIVDEIEHHPQFCLDLSDPLGAIRMGNSIGRFGDRHPAPALGFNARDRYFHFRRTFDEGLHAFVENAFESRVRYRYSCHGRTRISGYRITGPLAAVLPSFVESVAGSRDLKRSAQIEFFLKGFETAGRWRLTLVGCGRHHEGSSVTAIQLSPYHRKHNLPDQLRARPISDRSGIA